MQTMTSTLRYSTTTSTIHAARDDRMDRHQDAWCGARVGHRAGGPALWTGKFCKRCRLQADLSIVRAVVQAFLVWHQADDGRDLERARAILASITGVEEG
jgi:hypothetical protein